MSDNHLEHGQKVDLVIMVDVGLLDLHPVVAPEAAA
jgi:hypothetical protein